MRLVATGLKEPANRLRGRSSKLSVGNGAKRNSAGQRKPTTTNGRLQEVQFSELSTNTFT